MKLSHSYLLAAGLATARLLGVITIMPAFSRLGMTGIIRSGVALALALPVVPLLLEMLSRQPETLPLGMLAGLFLKEALVGLVVGAVFGVPFWAAETAGGTLDLQRGSAAGSLIDPASGGDTSITGTLLTLTMIAIFYAAGGLDILLKAVYQSYALWPPGEFFPILDARAGLLVLELLDSVMRMGMMLVAPVVIVLLLTDFAMAFMSKAAEQLHIFDLSLAAKNLVFSLILVLYSLYLIEHEGKLVATLLDAGSMIETFAPDVR